MRSFPTSCCRAWTALRCAASGSRTSGCKPIPFLFYTRRHDDPKYERFALELGAERFLARSVSPETLVTALDELLANVPKGNGGTGTMPIPTIDETVIQRPVGLDKAQRAAEAEKVQRIAELETPAQACRGVGDASASSRGIGERQRKQLRNWRALSASSRGAGERAAQAGRGAGERAAQAGRSGRARPTGAARCSRRSKSSKRPIGGSLPARRASAACSKRIRCRCGSPITRPAASSQSTTRHSRCTVIAARSSSDSSAPRSKRPTPRTAPRRSRISARTAARSRSRCARRKSNSTAAAPISFRATT